MRNRRKKEELVRMIGRGMKNGMAAGPDDPTVEAWKHIREVCLWTF